MTEIKNTEVIVEETTEVAVPEEKKEGIVKKGVNFVKANWKKGVALVAVGTAGFILGARSTANTEEDEAAEDCDVIEADDYVVEDAE